jgi:hypothetical protein
MARLTVFGTGPSEERRYTYNKDTWGEPTDITDENLDRDTVNGAIMYMVDYYEYRECDDYMLWEYLKEDFEDWTMETFLLAHPQLLRDFRDFLRENGCWAPKNGKSVAANLVEVIQGDKMHEWTAEEIADQIRIGKKFNSRWNPANAPKESEQRQTTILQDIIERIPTSTPEISLRSPTPPQQTHTLPREEQVQTPRQLSVEPPPRQQQHHDQNATTWQNQSKLLTDLMKVYTDDSKKYGGEVYDALDSKLQIFYDCCLKVGVAADFYDKAFSIMLKGRASTFYFDEIVGRNYSFVKMVEMTKANPNKALEKFLDTNSLKIRVEGWVKRA